MKHVKPNCVRPSLWNMRASSRICTRFGDMQRQRDIANGKISDLTNKLRRCVAVSADKDKTPKSCACGKKTKAVATHSRRATMLAKFWRISQSARVNLPRAALGGAFARRSSCFFSQSPSLYSMQSWRHTQGYRPGTIRDFGGLNVVISIRFRRPSR